MQQHTTRCWQILCHPTASRAVESHPNIVCSMCFAPHPHVTHTYSYTQFPLVITHKFTFTPSLPLPRYLSPPPPPVCEGSS